MLNLTVGPSLIKVKFKDLFREDNIQYELFRSSGGVPHIYDMEILWKRRQKIEPL